MSHRLVPAGPDIVFEDFDGDLVVLNLASGRYFGFNPAAALVWEALMAGADPRAIAQGTALPETITPFIAALISNGLVVADAAAPTAIPPALVLRLAATDSAPMIEAYDDLSDLIISDPIHDTDTAHGWPVRAPGP